VRSWQDRGEIGRSPWDARSLSWSPDDRTLAYSWETSGNLDLLNTTSADGSLLSHSRKLIGFTFALTPTLDADLTPDGTKVIASVYVRSSDRIDEFSAANGRRIRSIIPAGLGSTRLYDVLWTNSSGTLMIIDLYADSGNPHTVLLLRGTKLTPVTGVHDAVGSADDVAW
jgi:Tol biopolymer transport system component